MPDLATVEHRAGALAEGYIRKMLPGENAEYLDHLLRLDPLSRFTRFGTTMSDTALRRQAARVAAGKASMIGYYVDGVLRGVAELHPIPARKGSPRTAEAAFSVERAWQGKGVGSALMRDMVRAAQNRSIEHLQIVFLASNGRMKRIVVQHTGDLDVADNEVIGCVHPPRATAFSWFRELLGDAFSVVATAADLQTRLLPPALRGN